ncbi:MAG: threonylcarbamoyl-AMP synthase [Xanthobacteraceae bacterium]|nr:threonylcarbamoyl-AMP synthase [Xanthobacteraceae bacterium]
MTVGLTTRVLAADAAGIDVAARTLHDGGLLAFPTETVYGLGADATNGVAVARLFAAKGRPSFNPLIAHVCELADARALAQFNDDAIRLSQFWPGPLTLVLPRLPGCPVADLATAGLDTIAVRVPSHPVAQALLTKLQRPIVAPSANRSGHVSPTAAAHVLSDLSGRIDLILDGGTTPIGVESTIVACIGPQPLLLRAGGLPRSDVETALGHALGQHETTAVESGEAPLAPGMLSSHYAPRSSVRLNATRIEPGEALLAFGPPLPHAERVLNLSPGGDLVEAAANLFSHLRALDAAGAKAIAVMPIPSHGLGEAINDRLARAAAPRD